MESKTDNISIKLTVAVIVVTLIFAAMGLFFQEFLVLIQYPLLGILMVAIGLPHGATDFLLFRRINNSKLSKHQIIKFFFVYITAVLGFLGMWLLFPKLSFSIFILISSYHFGQSNWEHLKVSTFYSFLLNIFWGAFAIGGSVLWHWQESKLLIGQVIGTIPDISQGFMNNVQSGILIINCILIVFLKYSRSITKNQLLEEFGKLALLSLLFYYSPMLVGFTLYFALWHSLSSLMSQLSFYQKLWPDFTLSDYYRQAAPYTLLAVLGFVLMVFGHAYFLPGVSVISTFMVFIACVTLPHIVIVDDSYQIK